jgi:hypothetical protein
VGGGEAMTPPVVGVVGLDHWIRLFAGMGAGPPVLRVPAAVTAVVGTDYWIGEVKLYHG